MATGTVKSFNPAKRYCWGGSTAGPSHYRTLGRSDNSNGWFPTWMGAVYPRSAQRNWRQ